MFVVARIGAWVCWGQWIQGIKEQKKKVDGQWAGLYDGMKMEGVVLGFGTWSGGRLGCLASRESGIGRLRAGRGSRRGGQVWLGAGQVWSQDRDQVWCEVTREATCVDGGGKIGVFRHGRFISNPGPGPCCSAEFDQPL